MDPVWFSLLAVTVFGLLIFAFSLALVHSPGHTGRAHPGLTPAGRRIIALAESVFDDRAKAFCWLATPLALLGGAHPLEMLATADGTRRVEEILGRIEHENPVRSVL